MKFCFKVRSRLIPHIFPRSNPYKSRLFFPFTTAVGRNWTVTIYIVWSLKMHFQKQITAKYKKTKITHFFRLEKLLFISFLCIFPQFSPINIYVQYGKVTSTKSFRFSRLIFTRPSCSNLFKSACTPVYLIHQTSKL